MKKSMLIMIMVFFSISVFSQIKDSSILDKIDSVDIALNKKIEIGSFYLYKKYKKNISLRFKGNLEQKYLDFSNDENICRVYFYTNPYNHFINKFELEKNKNINKKFITLNKSFKTNFFGIKLGDSLNSVKLKITNVNLKIEKYNKGEFDCILIRKRFNTMFKDNTFLDAEYLAQYFFENSILTGIRVTFPFENIGEIPSAEMHKFRVSRNSQHRP